MDFTLLFPLQSSIGYFADFFGIELRPGLPVILFVKILQTLEINEVNKCITYVTIILHVNGQIKKIVFTLESLIDLSNKKFLCKFIRNILNHNCSFVFSFNCFSINVEFFFIENRIGIFFSLFIFFFLFFIFFNLGQLKKR